MPLMNRTLRVVVLISGSGMTLRNLLTLVAVGSLPIKVQLVISSNPKARGLNYADESKSVYLQNSSFEDSALMAPSITKWS